MKRALLISVTMVSMLAIASCGEDDPSSNSQTNNGAADAGDLDSSNTSPNGSTPNATTPNVDPNNVDPNSSTGDMGMADAADDSGTPTDMGDDAGAADMGGDATMGDDAGMADMGADSGMADMGPQPTYDVCEGAIDVTAGGTFTGTTAGESNDYGPFSASNGCPSGGAASGPDVVYSFAPANDTTYDFVVTPDGNTYNPMLYILTDCSNDQICEDGTVLNGPGAPESLRGFQAIGGTTYYLIVDGEVLSSGSFTLDVTLP